jgi:transcription elongation factor GreA
MTDQSTVLTREGYEQFEAELNYLRTVRRSEVAARLQRVFEEGGELTENAEYEDAKNEQAFVEGRIQELENLLSTAVIIDRNHPGDSVHLGSQVTVQEEGSEPEVFHIVGGAEAVLQAGHISNVSPLGKALLGKRVGDAVVIQTPDGPRTFAIIEIS